ncbi:response regulator [Candidatus Dojkabacteria bacterium]|uniref:Response regulator n=1 Tax=Candidatus Dojkabacteria bacterium TaxID=2099670 RepID=A0A955I4S2_9BACT|nr:response regulator [Candidatus Dojkabacteria bacterium]
MSDKKTILVVEDTESLSNVLKSELSQDGFEVITASNGEEGLTMADEKHPDLILLDIVMPEMDGMTMYKKLRESAWGRDALVIVLTNLPAKFSQEFSEILKADGVEYVVKLDTEITDIVAKVKQKLGITEEQVMPTPEIPEDPTAIA